MAPSRCSSLLAAVSVPDADGSLLQLNVQDTPFIGLDYEFICDGATGTMQGAGGNDDRVTAISGSMWIGIWGDHWEAGGKQEVEVALRVRSSNFCRPAGLGHAACQSAHRTPNWLDYNGLHVTAL
ncbi:hypothetical protein BJV74DRAFT_988619 [Russula compacta]|nr:hypothetical protein BJV74DRAFT_988619 [Russula compacta]